MFTSCNREKGERFESVALGESDKLDKLYGSFEPVFRQLYGSFESVKVDSPHQCSRC